MKPSLKYYLATMIVCVFIFNSCKKKEDALTPAPAPDSIPAATGDVPLTDDQSAFLATVQDTFIRLEDIILDDGQNVRSFLEINDPDFLLTYPSRGVSSTAALSPREQKNMFLSRMFTVGNYLVDDTKHTHPAGGANEPAQTGLAYSWGSKDYNIRQLPPTKAEVTSLCPGGCNDLKIYGLDCTGMIYNMTTLSFLPPVQPKSNYFMGTIVNAELWTTAFRYSTDYQDLKMKDKGQLTKAEMINGDMIFWGRHVGVYINGWFYQSNGKSCKPGCNNNLSQGSGPRCISLAEVLGYGLGSYKVFRISYGQNYTLTLTHSYTGTTNSFICYLGNYIDTTIIHITVSADGDVTLNDINNSTPPITYQSANCNCLGMSFVNGSNIEYTDFSATINGITMSCDLTYTLCTTTDIYQCSPNPAIFTAPGQVIPGNVDAYNLIMPPDSIAYTVSNALGNGTLTLKRD